MSITALYNAATENVLLVMKSEKTRLKPYTETKLCINIYLRRKYGTQKKKPVALIRKRTIPTE
jgi:hypothetical protein